MPAVHTPSYRRGQERADREKKSRRQRLATLWGRFVRLMLAEGLADPEQLRQIAGEGAKRMLMQSRIGRGEPRGWYFDSALEADVRRGEPTTALPGSRDKIELMRLRFEQGEDILCEGDYDPRDLPD